MVRAPILAPILHLDRDRAFVGLVRRQLAARYRGPIVHAEDADAAQHLVSKHVEWGGIVTAVGLGDAPRGGLAFLRHLRTDLPFVPALLVAEVGVEQLLIESAALGAVVSSKPPSEETLLRFLGDVRECALLRDDPVWLASTASGYETLSAAERRVLETFLELGERRAVARALRIADSTYQKHTGRVLTKCGADSMRQLADRIRMNILSDRVRPVMSVDCS